MNSHLRTNYIRNSRGQALIQVMLAIGLVGLLAVGITQVSHNVDVINQRNALNKNAEALTVMLRSLLSTRTLSAQFLTVDPVLEPPNAVAPAIGVDGLFEVGGVQRPLNYKMDLRITIPYYDAPNNFFPRAVPDGNLDDFQMHLDELYFTITSGVTGPGTTARQRTYSGIMRFIASMTQSPFTTVSRELGRFVCEVQFAPPVAPDTKNIGELISCYAEESPEQMCRNMGCVYDVDAVPACKCGVYINPGCNPARCSDLGGDYYLRGILPNGCPDCSRIGDSFTCNAADFGGYPHVLVGLTYDVNGNARPDCRPYYASLNPDPAPGAYRWRLMPFGQCSKACDDGSGGGGADQFGNDGTQTATHYCQETATNLIVPDANCTAKPADVTQDCGRQACSCTGNVSWTEGASSCVVNGVAFTDSDSDPATFEDMLVTDSSGSDTGSAAFRCQNGTISGPLGAPAPDCNTAAVTFITNTGCGACPNGDSGYTAAPDTNGDTVTEECWSVAAGEVDVTGVTGCTMNVRYCNLTGNRTGRFKDIPGVGGWSGWGSYTPANDLTPLGSTVGAICSVNGNDVSWEIRNCSTAYVGFCGSPIY